MASRAQSVTLTYVAWDTANSTGKTGDSANHTLRWVKDGTSSAPTNSASEVDATNCPGLYKITLTSGECTCDAGTLCGKSSTADVVILPVTITFEQLPTAAPDAAGGLPISDAGGLDLDTLLARLDAAITTRASQATLDMVDGIVDAILIDTVEIGTAGAGLTEVGGTGDHLTAVPWNAAWDAEVQSECADALVAYDPPTNAEMAAAFTEIKGSTWSSSTDTLEAIRDRGDAAWITATGFSTLDAAGVRTAVGLASANLDTQLAAIGLAALDRTGYKLASDGLDLVVIEIGLNARQALAIIAAEAAGDWAYSSTAVFKGAGVATTRITGTLTDTTRTVTLSPPA